MSVLVLGGAGYIGSHTVYALIEKGEDVVIVDNLQTGFKQLIHPKAKFYQGDLRDKEFLNNVFEKEDIKGVIHFAANSLVGVSMKEPLEYYNNNVYGMICLLEVMKEHGVKYIVFSSTAATYGEPKQIPITESDKTNPTNTYGETKLAMEKMMKWCDQAYGMKYVALRYFNACGAHENGLIGELHNPETHLIPLILQVPLKKRETIYVFGNDYDTPDGSCIRDYIYVVDLAKAHVIAMDRILNNKQKEKVEVFNIGTGKGVSVLELINTFEKATGVKLNYQIVGRRAGDIEKVWANPDFANKELGWKAEANLEDTLRSAWNWQLKLRERGIQ